MKTVFRNNQEGPQKDVWYAILTDEEILDREIASPLYDSEDKAFEEAMFSHTVDMYVVEVKLITKVIG